LIEVVKATGSTNADLTSRLTAGHPVLECDWLVADRQTSGRGRQGRIWSDGAGNFMGSTAVYLRENDPAAHTLSLVAGFAVYASIEACAPDLAGLMLKWPNDVLIQDAKLAGLLLERNGNIVIVGVGVNLAQAPQLPGRITASLAACGFTVGRDEFAAKVDEHWARALDVWHNGGWAELRGAWLTRAHPFDTPLKVHGPDGSIVAGTFAGLACDGALQLRLSTGTRRTIHAGEVDLDNRR
jgi:BirA family biotin operon repressor/biotin-[acetyl-CoA-carboxylase] ligase